MQLNWLYLTECDYETLIDEDCDIYEGDTLLFSFRKGGLSLSKPFEEIFNKVYKDFIPSYRFNQWHSLGRVLTCGEYNLLKKGSAGLIQSFEQIEYELKSDDSPSYNLWDENLGGWRKLREFLDTVPSKEDFQKFFSLYVLQTQEKDYRRAMVYRDIEFFKTEAELSQQLLKEEVSMVGANINHRLRSHTDGYSGNNCLLTVVESEGSTYSGNYLVFPEKGIAFNVRHDDYLIAPQNRLLHGNTRRIGFGERVSLVFYPSNGTWSREWFIEEKPVVIPTTVTMRQARLALLKQNLLSQVEEALASLPSPEKEEALIEWEYATEVLRDSSLVQSLAAGLGLDETTLDDLFTLAASL